MRDVDADHHGLTVADGAKVRGRKGLVGAAHLEVYLQGDVGHVLGLAFCDLLGDDANGMDAIAGIGWA